MAEFAELGFAGARVDRIVNRARVNKQAVYYHFGSKEELYRASLALAYGEFRLSERWRASDVPAEQAMRELLAAIFDHIQANEKGTSIIAHENRYHGRHLTRALRSRIQAAVAPIIDSIAGVLKRGQQEGLFSTRMGAIHLYLSIICLCMFYFTNIYTLSAILGRDLATARSIAGWRKHVIEFVVDSLKAR